MKRERACGIHSVGSLLENHPEQVIQIWLGANRARLEPLVQLAQRFGIPTQNARDTTLGKLAGGEPHQGVVAEFQPPEPIGEPGLYGLVEQAGDSLLLVALDQVQDPHNLGACLRSAAAAGAHAVIIPRSRSAGLTAVARRAAAGGAEHVPVIEVTNLARTLQQLRKQDVWCIGLAGDGDHSIWQLDLARPLLLVMGGEEAGLRRLTRERCDTLARIPMAGQIESLNVSVATGIALFEALRQRGVQ
ncbi:MAG: 23S rRNA (guanosine(2251)-2'-O)-methyltransferase RlmB [Wenzhouxiangellaceae bacterium]